jgi:hypothetical protein
LAFQNFTAQDAEAARSRMAQHLAAIDANLRAFSRIAEEA